MNPLKNWAEPVRRVDVVVDYRGLQRRRCSSTGAPLRCGP